VSAPRDGRTPRPGGRRAALRPKNRCDLKRVLVLVGRLGNEGARCYRCNVRIVTNLVESPNRNVTNLIDDVMPARLRVLQAVADASVSIDFLKLTPSGLSFLVSSDEASRVKSALSGTGGDFSLRLDRSIVMIHAVNIRDEEGLIAMVMREAISEGTAIDHVGDMHDRLLLVVSEADAARLNRRLEIRLNEEVTLGN